jgi:hypothetical protein
MDNVKESFTTKCPKLYCSRGILIRFEENIAPVVYQLYKKGYRFVLKACSGHAHKPNSYIFIEFSENALIDDCPKDFEIVHGEQSSIICKHIETKDMKSKQIETFKAIVQLWAWVDSLEDYNTGTN